MSRKTVKRHPGRPDINAQYSARHIRRTLAIYKQLMKPGGDYQFGNLTARFHKLDENETQAWQDDLLTYSKDVQDEIKRHIIHALTRVNQQGRESPVPLTIEWKAGSKAVTLTYDPSGPSYKMQISGFPAPATKPSTKRRPKKK